MNINKNIVLAISDMTEKLNNELSKNRYDVSQKAIDLTYAIYNLAKTLDALTIKYPTDV